MRLLKKKKRKRYVNHSCCSLLLSVFQCFKERVANKKNIQDQIIFQNKNPGSRKGRKRYFVDNYINYCGKSIPIFSKSQEKNCKI